MNSFHAYINGVQLLNVYSIVLLLCNWYSCYSLGQILYYYQLITHFDPRTIRAATVTAERLSARHLIPLHCWIAFVCMYVCMYVSMSSSARCCGAVWVVTPLSTLLILLCLSALTVSSALVQCSTGRHPH